MIKKTAIVTAIVLLAVGVMLPVMLILPNHIANAEDNAFYLFIEDLNHPTSAQNLVSNKQVGIFASPYNTKNFCYIFKTSSDKDNTYLFNDTITLLPLKNNEIYTVYYFDKFTFKLIEKMRVSYDIEKPKISANTQRENVSNNETVIGKPVVIRANDNFGNVKIYMSKNDNVNKLCDSPTYTISEDGKYTFYAVDIANNYSDDFTITYYEQEPEKPSEPDTPSRPTKPITPDDSESTVVEEETKTVKPMIVIAVVVGAVIIGVIVFVIVYKRAKDNANTAQFDDDE